MARDATQDEVLAYLRSEHPGVYDVAAWARRAVLDADPDLAERIFRGWRGVGFRHPEAGFVCALYERDGGLVLLFEHGATMADPDSVLRGGGTQTRFLAIDEHDEETAARIRRYVQQAIGERLLR